MTKANHNPNVETFLKIYSQSLLSTGLTRGLDESTYIQTRLDTSLKEDVLKGKKKLVVLTGNAGDGKTAFIQLIEAEAKSKGGDFISITDNGCNFKYNDFEFETLYDGSQDFNGQKNDVLLKHFFKPFEGITEPKAKVVKIIAINEGKLRDFILTKKEYSWLAKQVHHYLEYENYLLPEVITFINLNNRAIVDVCDSNSILDNLLDILLDKNNLHKFWEPCNSDNCDYSDKCYIKNNINSLNEDKSGQIIKNRLKELILAIYLKKEKHITMRDIRSVISFILFNKYTCNQIKADIDKGTNLLDRFYYNSAFNKDEQDRIVSILRTIDVADMPLPKIENFLYCNNPNSASITQLFNDIQVSSKPDLCYLEKYFLDKPEGTSDTDERRNANAEIYLTALKRKVFFEGNDDLLKEQYNISHHSFLPYKYYKDFVDYLKTGIDTGNKLRNNIVLAISKSEKIYNEVIGSENVCISSSSSKKSQTKAFYGFKAADFEIALPQVGNQTNYIEFFPDHIIFRHVDKKAALEINIDLFEILMRIKEGYVPTSIEIQTFFLNLEMFKRRILSKRSMKVFLTEDDSNLYSFEKSENGKLVLNKI